MKKVKYTEPDFETPSKVGWKLKLIGLAKITAQKVHARNAKNEIKLVAFMS